MKGIGSALKVGVLVIVAVVLGYMSWKTVGERAAGKNARKYHAFFRDASGLFDKTRVVVAGLTIGEIGSRSLEGNRARVTVRIRKDIVLYENAVLFKKASSLIGEFYLDIDPGSPTSTGLDGTAQTNQVIPEGGEIKNVQEATTTDQIMRAVSTTLPLVNETLVQVRDLTKEIRELTTGPVTSMAKNLDTAVSDQIKRVGEILDRTNRILITVQGITGKTAEDVIATVRNVRDASQGLRELLAVGQGEVVQSGGKIREGIDKLVSSVSSLERTLTNTADVAQKINEGDGTIGKLVNDPQIANDIGEISEQASGFVRKLTGLQTIVGLTSEYNIIARSLKTYLSLQLVPSADKYYLLELIDDPRGARKHEIIATRTTDPNEPPTKIEERVTVASRFRFSFMFAKRIDFATLRFGIKESTGGVGVDFSLLGKRLEIRTDLFDVSANIFPRLKVEAALNFFQFLYFVAGVDDILNSELGSPAGGGRDYFFGAQLRFNDNDLKTLLTVGGGALGAAGGGQ